MMPDKKIKGTIEPIAPWEPLLAIVSKQQWCDLKELCAQLKITECSLQHKLQFLQTLGFVFDKDNKRGVRLLSEFAPLDVETLKRPNIHCIDYFLTVGSMGYSSQIAYGIAIKKPDTNIICLDGDGALLMHMGGMTTIGISNLKNYNHIILNNGVHDSVGGQPTLGFDVDFCKMADACNYKNIFGPLKTETEISNALIELSSLNGPNFIDIHVKPGARADLGRPKSSPIENKKLFIEKLNK